MSEAYLKEYFDEDKNSNKNSRNKYQSVESDNKKNKIYGFGRNDSIIRIKRIYESVY